MRDVQEENNRLRAEIQVYHDAAALYGINPMTMLTLAKSQIKTCADNIRLVEKMANVLGLFSDVSEGLSEEEVQDAITHYDGDGSKPYCDLVYCGLNIVRKYLYVRGELNEWRQNALPFSK